MSDWKAYNLDKDDSELIQDFIALVKLIDNLDGYFKSNEQVIELCDTIIKRMVDNNVITFDISVLDKKTKEVLMQGLTKLVVGSVEVAMAERIWMGQDTFIVSEKKGFHILNSQRVSFGLIRMNYDSSIREFIPFIEPFILDIEYTNKLPVDYDLSRLDDNDLYELHIECHDDARIHAIQTKEKPLMWMIKKHAYITKEMKARKIDHETYCELDRMSGEVNISKDIFIKDVLSKLPVDEIISYPLLSIQGDSLLSGMGSKIILNVNWPEYDVKFYEKLKSMVEKNLPKDRVVLRPDKAGHKDNFLPVMTLNIKRVPSDNLKVLNIEQGFFAKERVKNNG